MKINNNNNNNNDWRRILHSLVRSLEMVHLAVWLVTLWT
jgi:hypothetical protein